MGQGLVYTICGIVNNQICRMRCQPAAWQQRRSMYNRNTVDTKGLLMYHVLRPGPVLVVGAGWIGSRRAELAAKSGAKVRVVDPNLGDHVVADERIHRAFKPQDLETVSLVFVATNDVEVNQEVARLARTRGIPVNVADVPELCDFFLPALVQQGNLLIGISTKGGCPGYAAYVRQRLTPVVGEAWGEALEILSCARRWSRGNPDHSAWRQIPMDCLIEACEQHDSARVDDLLTEALGSGITADVIGAKWGC